MDGMNAKVDAYLRDGCGRCDLYATPGCKVNTWRDELVELRRIVLECGLTEEVKWGVPTYTVDNANVVMISALKDYCNLSFLKGALLKDPEGILVKQGRNVQAARIIKFVDAQAVIAQEPVLKAYIQEAVEVEKAGLTYEFKDTSEYDVPDEFQRRLDEDPALRAAFEALTPGRQRGYLLHFSGAKQSKTRASRVEKCIPRIFEGLGMHDRRA